MFGKEYLFRVNQLLNEAVPSGSWVDKKTSFDFLYEAAKDFCREAKVMHDVQVITTVATQPDYGLNPDFLEIFSTKGFRDEDKVIDYYDGTSHQWVSWKAPEEALYGYSTATVLVPSNFSIMDRTPEDRVTGTATANGVNAGGESVLTDNTATFACYPGDRVINTTTGDIGIVLNQISATQLYTAMFDIDDRASTYASWTSADRYIIQPATRFNVYLTSPPSTTGHTVTIPYLKIPTPVYSDYGSYSFAVGYEEALVNYAVWRYKYRDTSRANKEDSLYKFYDGMVRRARSNRNMMVGTKSMQVSWKK